MNLSFVNVKRIVNDGIEYYLQKADVTDNDKFWFAYRYSCNLRDTAASLNAEVRGPDLSSRVRVDREIIEGKRRFFAYRMLPTDAGLPSPKFSMAFRLRDTLNLLPYQPPVVEHLCNAILSHNVAIDGSDTGLGKTYHALSVCRNLVMRPAVICRKSGIAGWRRGCNFMRIEPLFVTNWEQAKNGNFPYVTRSRHEYNGAYSFTWNLPKDTLLIFDEAHGGSVSGTINNSLWLGAKGIPHMSLSATFADRPSRLKTLLYLLGVVKDDEQFINWLEYRGHFQNSHEELETLSGVEDMKEINKILYPAYGYRIGYDHPSVKAYVPDARYITQIVSLSDADTRLQNKLYIDTISKIEHYRSLGKQADALVADLRYRQATELFKAPVLADSATNLLAQGVSVAIFVNFRETLAFLAKHLKTRSLIFGAQEQKGIPRQDVIDSFQENRERLIVCMVNAGGQSIDLHDVYGGHQRVALICPCYSPINLRQVMGRVRRARAKTPPVISLIYAAGTVEEKVAETVNKKLDNIAALNDGDLMEEDIFNIGISPEERENEE